MNMFDQNRILEVLEAIRILFPHIEFGCAGGPSKIILGPQPTSARFIHLKLTSCDAFHLKYIEVFEPGSTKPLDISGCKMTISSCYPGTENHSLSNRFLKEHGASFGFHTKREEEPWVEIDLGRSISISRLVIHNRTDECIERARYLRVLISADGTQWQNVFSKNEMIGKLQNTISNSLADFHPQADAWPLSNILLQAVVGEYKAANDALKCLNIPRDIKNRIAKSITIALLRDRNLEWTDHGIKRTFRFWSDEEKKRYLCFTQEVISILTKASFKACVGYGGVLAFVRDHDLIPHDDDLDVIVSCERTDFSDITAALAELENILSSAGLKVSGDHLTHRHVSNGGPVLDVFVGFQEGEFVSWFPGPRKVLRYEDIFQPLECNFLNSRIWLPRNPFAYVEAVYGKDWRMPQERWTHTWDRREYSNWFEKETLA